MSRFAENQGAEANRKQEAPKTRRPCNSISRGLRQHQILRSFLCLTARAHLRGPPRVLLALARARRFAIASAGHAFPPLTGAGPVHIRAR